MNDTHSDVPATPDPLEAFFARFAAIPGFSYQPAASAQNNFRRLCKASGWEANSSARTDARQAFQDALVQEFNLIFGVDGDDIAVWHALCLVIGIVPHPDSIDACRKLVWDAHVNIVDLIEVVRTGRPVRQFRTLDELTKYTKNTDQFFPKRKAYKSGLLKELLREIVNPYFGKRRNGSQKREARKREAAAPSSQN